MDNLKTLYANLNGKYPEVYYDISTNTYFIDDEELPASEFYPTENNNYVRHKSGQIYEVMPFD